MPYQGGIQLLPETQRRPTLASYTSGNGYFYVGVVIGIAVIIIGAIGGSYKASLNETIATLDRQLQDTEDQRNKEQEAVLMNTAKQSAVMGSLLSSKIYWSQALQYMERMMQSGVQLTRMSASTTKKSIGFSAMATNYTSVARQIAAFVAGTGVSDIAVTSLKATNQGGVTFEGELLIDQKVMLNKPLPK